MFPKEHSKMLFIVMFFERSKKSGDIKKTSPLSVRERIMEIKNRNTPRIQRS